MSLRAKTTNDFDLKVQSKAVVSFLPTHSINKSMYFKRLKSTHMCTQCKYRVHIFTFSQTMSPGRDSLNKIINK